ncbi:MAG: hypothetical protein JST53_18250 [Actinobacteria bacterium]|nr:hypothetical protein [Actinomycetota bacterium]
MTIASVRRRLDETLFQEPPPPDPAAKGAPRLLLVGGLLVVAVLAQMLRIGWSISLHSLWAEDGPIYFSGAVHSSVGGSLFDTYATYLVFVPRMVGEIGGLVPLQDAPAAISISSGLIVAISGWIVWEATAGLIESPWLRAALALMTVLAPTGGLESIVSGAYVPWFMLFATFWILLWRPRTALVAAGAGFSALLTGLSTPGVWFFIPLALLRTFAIRDRRDGLVLGGYWIGALVQVPVLLLNKEEAVTPLWSHDILTTYLQRVVDGAFLGLKLGGKAWEHTGWLGLVIIVAVLLAALIIGVVRAGFTARLFAALAILISAVMFIVSVYQRALGEQMVWPSHAWSEGGGRYAIVPALLLFSVAAVLIDKRSRRRPEEGRPNWLAWGLALLAVVVVATSFRVEDPEIRGAPPWEASLDHSAEVCKSEPPEAETGVATSPPGWGLNIPCVQLAKFEK